jgi:hypothetical protein
MVGVGQTGIMEVGREVYLSIANLLYQNVSRSKNHMEIYDYELAKVIGLVRVPVETTTSAARSVVSIKTIVYESR